MFNKFKFLALAEVDGTWPSRTYVGAPTSAGAGWTLTGSVSSTLLSLLSSELLE